MAKSYCKWPVIVVIIVGVLFTVSMIFCIYKCGKCATCCCCCNCCSCCAPSGGGSSGHKRMESGQPYPQPYPAPAQGYNHTPIAPPTIDSRPVNQQYRSHAAPMFTPAEPEAPQYARFESNSKPVNEDALPAMPSWSEAKSTRVEETVMPEKRGDLELDRLDHSGSMNSAAAIGNARRSPGPSPIQRSPTHDTYGFPPDYQNDSFVSAAPQRNQHSSPGPYGGQYNQYEDGYRGVTPVSSLSPVHTAGAGYGRRSPHDNYPNDNYAQPYSQPGPRRSPGPNHGYENQAYNNNYSTPSNARSYESPIYQNEPVELPSPVVPRHDNYGLPAPMRSPSPQYAPSGSTRYEAPAASSYPGQQTYGSEASYPGQPAYQAYQPQETGVARKPAPGGY